MRLSVLLLTLSPLWAQDPIASRDVLNEGVRDFKGAHYPEAIQSFQRAVDLDPASVTARLYLATAYMQQYVPGNDSSENLQMAARAEDGFLQILALEPHNTLALASIASIALSQKRWNDARAWYEHIIADEPKNADAYYSLGFIAWSEWYPAYQQARARLGMRPEAPGPLPDPGMRRELAARFGASLESGIANLQRVLELNPRHEDAMAYMNLLIRERADLRDTPEEYRRDTAEADQWVQKAMETKRLKGPQAPAAAPGSNGEPRIRVGPAIQEQKLIRRVEPVYPQLARQARIQGIVRLNLILAKEGSVSNVAVLSGHPLLVPAALEAVKQWVYQPTLLNGNPVEVVTEVEVLFNLDPSVIVK